MTRHTRLSITLLVTLSAAVACSSSQPASEQPGATAAAVDTRNVSTNKNDYPVFPDADAGADPSVPAEMGGKGFKGEGWETNTDFDLIGDPRAVKGGLYRDAILDFPGTLRMAGPESNTSTNYAIMGMAY